jgi:hypothetical protein
MLFFAGDKRLPASLSCIGGAGEEDKMQREGETGCIVVNWNVSNKLSG